VLRVVNSTPFLVGFLPWEDLEGRPKLTVVLKATLAIRHGEVTAIASEQLPLFLADVPYSDDPNATVRFEADMAPFKPSADIVLVGKAHAPGGRPVTDLEVKLRVGSLEKSIHIVGDRKWYFTTWVSLVPSMTLPEPFNTMDLVYERAFGGMDPSAGRYCAENLVGRGFIGKVTYKSVHEKPLPNLEDPQNLIKSPASYPRPCGFGFYGRGWKPRLAYAGTYDEKYRKERAPATPLDFSYALFNGAHPDLQVKGYLRGDEAIEMENLGPQARVRFRLPGLLPKVRLSRWRISSEKWLAEHPQSDLDAFAQQVSRSEEALPVWLDTLVLIPDEEILYLLYRGVTALTDPSGLEIATVQVAL